MVLVVFVVRFVDFFFFEGKTVATLYFGQSQIAVHLEDLQLSTEKFIE